MRTPRIPWVLTPEALRPYAPGVWDPDADPVELYYLPDDFTQAHDLAADHPEKVAGAQGAVLAGGRDGTRCCRCWPRSSAFFGITPPLRGHRQDRVTAVTSRTSRPGMIPRIYNHSYTISADLLIPREGVEGVIVAEADHLGGFSLFVDDGRLTHTYSMMGVFVYRQQADEPLPDRRGERADGVRRRRAPSPPPAGRSRCTSTTHPSVAAGWTTPCRSGSPPTPAWTSAATTARVVDLSYADRQPFAFTGTIKKVVFDVKPHPKAKDEHAAAHGRAPRARSTRALGMNPTAGLKVALAALRPRDHRRPDRQLPVPRRRPGRLSSRAGLRRVPARRDRGRQGPDRQGHRGTVRPHGPRDGPGAGHPRVPHRPAGPAAACRSPPASVP